MPISPAGWTWLSATLIDMEITRDTTSLQGKTPVWVPRADGVALEQLPAGRQPGGCGWAPACATWEAEMDAANTDKVPDYLLMDMSASYDLAAPQRSLKGWGCRSAPATCSTRPTTPATTRTTAGSGHSATWRLDSNTYSDPAPRAASGAFTSLRAAMTASTSLPRGPAGRWRCSRAHPGGGSRHPVCGGGQPDPLPQGAGTGGGESASVAGHSPPRRPRPRWRPPSMPTGGRHTPEAGPAYWLTRSWGMLCWQSIYLAMVAVYRVGAVPALDRLGRWYEAGLVSGFCLPGEPMIRGGRCVDQGGGLSAAQPPAAVRAVCRGAATAARIRASAPGGRSAGGPGQGCPISLER